MEHYYIKKYHNWLELNESEFTDDQIIYFNVKLKNIFSDSTRSRHGILEQVDYLKDKLSETANRLFPSFNLSHIEFSSYRQQIGITLEGKSLSEENIEVKLHFDFLNFLSLSYPELLRKMFTDYSFKHQIPSNKQFICITNTNKDKPITEFNLRLQVPKLNNVSPEEFKKDLINILLSHNFEYTPIEFLRNTVISDFISTFESNLNDQISRLFINSDDLIKQIGLSSNDELELTKIENEFAAYLLISINLDMLKNSIVEKTIITPAELTSQLDKLIAPIFNIDYEKLTLSEKTNTIPLLKKIMRELLKYHNRGGIEELISENATVKLIQYIEPFLEEIDIDIPENISNK